MVERRTSFLHVFLQVFGEFHTRKNALCYKNPVSQDVHLIVADINFTLTIF